MGAHAHVGWEWAATAEAAVQALRAQGTHVVGLETARALVYILTVPCKLRSIARHTAPHRVPYHAVAHTMCWRTVRLIEQPRAHEPSRAVHAPHMRTRIAHARRGHGTGGVHQVPAAPYAHEYTFPHGGGGVAILLGNERHGLSPQMLALCDGVASYVGDSRPEAPASIRLRAAANLGLVQPRRECSG